MITGVMGMLITLAIAPLAARVYEQPALVGLLAVMSLAIPLQTLQIVPKALLQAQLRFGTGVKLAFVASLSTAALTVLCAYLGFGAYSFAIPLPITAALVAAMTWQAAKPRIKKGLHFKYWKYLVGDSLTLAGSRAMLSLVGQGDYMVLGLARFPDAAIGTYVFAFNIALQPFRFIATSVQSVIFPSLSQESLSREQKIRAMVRAARLLTLVIVPSCALTILLAGPLFRVVVPARWLDAVPVLQIISVSVMVSSPGWPALSLLMAQRRFGELFRVCLINGITFFGSVSLAAWLDRSIESVAIAVTLWNIASSPFMFWVAVGREQPYLQYYSETYRPYLAGLGAALPCLAVLAFMPVGVFGDVTAVLVITVVFCVSYFLLLRQCAAKDLSDFLAQLAPILSKIAGRLPGKLAFEIPERRDR